MRNENSRKTWEQPWSYREGAIVTVAILLLGFGLQVVSGGTVLLLAGFPWNLISGIIFLLLLVLSYFLWKNRSIIKGLGSVKAALPAILGFTFMVLLMGFVKQDVQHKSQLVRILGLSHLVKTWPFILINVYLLILLGVVTLKRMSPFNLKNARFFLNHFGLFLVLFATALGSSDMQRLTMNCYEKQAQNQAFDESGRIVAMPFSVELLNFHIDEFRPKLILIDNKTGRPVQEKGKTPFELMDRDSLNLSMFHIKVEQFLAASAKMNESYFAAEDKGAVTSALLKVTGIEDKTDVTGWVCSGNYSWPSEALKLTDAYSLAMLPPEPRKFSSELNILSGENNKLKTILEVNKPFHVFGWTIYQINYNSEMGRWSDLSVLQLVRDPWLPVVYVGIFMMMAGAIFLFVYGKPKNGGTEHVA
ncbi:MAG: hypothetical protein WC384_02040 [Prolixibacteraceae bacterium]|jgi:hypothetical protein